jgi:hypothetical protein
MTENLNVQPFVSVQLTADEQRAVDLAQELADAFGRIVGWGATRDRDLGEMHAKLRDIQRAVMAQAIARAYPDRFALLGNRSAKDDHGLGPSVVAS